MLLIPCEACVAALLLTWALASLLNQFDLPSTAWLRAHDYLKLLPRWRFFERESGQADYRLLYRDRDAVGRLSRWHEIPVMEARKPWHAIWNPYRHTVRLLGDLASALHGSELRHQDAVMLTLPYLLLLGVIIRATGDGGSVQRQFAILWTTGWSSGAAPSTQILFQSRFHRVD